jgi:iron(II)-dependent oxidoreductase
MRNGADAPVAVPEFEIDAQPVTWAQYVEFVDDGGYDRRSCGTRKAGNGCKR